MRFVGYARVSTGEQGVSGAGLKAQVAVIGAEVARRGWELLELEQDVLSGKTVNRPGLQRALGLCRSGDADGIVVAKLDRLSRSVIDFATLLREAVKNDWNVVALDFGLDLSTPQGKLVANVLMSVAEWEREIIGQRTKAALAVKRSEGVQLGRPPVLSEDLVQRIVRERRDGRALAAIAAGLNEDGISTAHGGRCWYPATVAGIVRRANDVADAAEVNR